MSFQTAVRFRYTNGFLGQVLRDVPSVVKSWRLSSQTAQTNTFGKAFTNVAAEFAAQSGLDSIPVAQVGLSAAGAGFAGILCNPEEFASSGSTSGTLSPSLDLAAYSRAQLMTQGEVVVSFATSVTYGDPVYFDNVTGALANATGAGLTLIVGAKVTRTIAAAGLTTISLDA